MHIEPQRLEGDAVQLQIAAGEKCCGRPLASTSHHGCSGESHPTSPMEGHNGELTLGVSPSGGTRAVLLLPRQG